MGIEIAKLVRTFLVAIFVLLAAVVMFALRATSLQDENTKLMVENAELKKENNVLIYERIEWQKTAATALRARGWWVPESNVEDLKPEYLNRALNPCKKLGGDAWLSSDVCKRAIERADDSGDTGFPIRIEIAEHWPEMIHAIP